LAADVEVGFLGKPLGLRIDAQLPENAAEAIAHVNVKEFRPSDFGPHRVSDYDLADFRFSLRLDGEGRVSARDGQLQTVALHVGVGAGEARLAMLPATVSLRSASVDVTYDPKKDAYQIPVLHLELAPNVE